MPEADLDVLGAWAASGAMALTGRAGGPPLGPPAPLVPGLARLGARLAEHASERGAALGMDPLRMLCDRAALAGLARHGDTSCGGATRLLRASDGWIAVSLARESDVELVPAWLELDVLPSDPWGEVEAGVSTRLTGDVVARAVMLGMPVAALDEDRPRADRLDGVRATTFARRRARINRERPVVVDLSSLWAGPLCAHILKAMDARVIKVESTRRPDGARHGIPAFFDHLNRGKECVALDFESAEDVATLQALLTYADVVVEASRPRALEQLGIVPADVLSQGPAVWVSITGHGRGAGDRVAFGDDAAVAGGLVVWDEGGPCFCVDAVADPLTGLVAADAALDALSARDGDDAVLLDIAMSSVAAAFAGPTLAVPTGLEARAPTAPAVTGHAPPLGAHTDAICAELARSR
jgi:crotonobetainyl-CoA:carnitine CoA-transferase CaiB-like acyl-CoA transferase